MQKTLHLHGIQGVYNLCMNELNQNCLVSLDRRTPTGADKPELHSHDANVFKQEGRDREGGGCLLPNILRGGLRGTPGPVCGIQFPSGVGLFC